MTDERLRSGLADDVSRVVHASENLLADDDWRLVASFLAHQEYEECVDLLSAILDHSVEPVPAALRLAVNALRDELQASLRLGDNRTQV